MTRALSDVDEAEQVVQTVISRPEVCPHCQGERVVRNGHASRLQRYKRRNCARIFNSMAETPLARMRHEGKWERWPKFCARV